VFKVATFNANSIRSRIHIIEKWLQKEAPDVLAIQETKVVDELFPKDVFEKSGYNVVFRGQKAYSGVAIASSCNSSTYSTKPIYSYRYQYSFLFYAIISLL
jgi:exonuclease III